MINPTISLGSHTHNKSSVGQSGHSEENIIPSNHKIERPIAKYIKKNALMKITANTLIRKHQPRQNKTEITMQSPSISCLYADHLYKKGHNNFVESIAVEKYRKKYQEQKLSKENFEQQNEKMREQIDKINQDLCNMKFAYRTLTIESKQLRERLKEKQLNSVQNRGKSTNRSSNRRNHRKTETPKKIIFTSEMAEEIIQIPQVSIKENIQQVLDESISIDPLNDRTDYEQFQTVKPLKYSQSNKKIMRRSNTIELQLQQANSIEFIQDQPQSVKLKLIQTIEDNMLVIMNDPNLKEHILRMFNADKQQQMFILNTKIASIELNFQEKIKNMREQTEKLLETITLKEREIIELQQKQADFIQCIQLKDQQIFTQKERVSLCQEQLQIRSKEIVDLKASIQRVESQNIMYLRKEQERRAQALALKKFWQGLKINNEKINSFMQEQFNDKTRKCEGSFQQKISYLAHLYRKKQLVYDEYVNNNSKMMKQYEVMVDSLERKLYDNEKFHQKLADMIKKGEVNKAITTLIGYCQIDPQK